MFTCIVDDPDNVENGRRFAGVRNRSVSAGKRPL